MRDKWYGDDRDLVKWGVLVELACRYQIKHILQVLYLRPTIWGRLEIDGESVELPLAVVQHFRRTTSVSSIQCSARVEVIAESFLDRRNYHELVMRRVQSRPKAPGIIFLDPDTGLEPRVAKLQHVLEAELAEIWRGLRSGDVMVFYQHQTNRNGTPWIKPKKAQFERAIAVRPGSAKIARSPVIAPDVAFFYIRKNHDQPTVSQ